MNLKLTESYTIALPADPNIENSRRQVLNAGYSYVQPKKPTNPKLIHVSEEMLSELGIGGDEARSDEFLNIVSGAKVYPNTNPYAMAYAGHQFGNWAGQLGDGRAINLFEIKNNDNLWALQLKGAGETPYSRQGDGLAVLRSSIREFLCSEAMFHLGVPTTRALSLVLTGDQVLRDVLYDGHPEYEQGAIVSRVAPSFVRFGNFELFAARQDFDNLERLANYVIEQFYSDLGVPSKEVYIEFFRRVMNNTLEMIIHWQRVGFVHGVMNTDNMSILGLTIDYGPYGWLEGFDFGWTPNTTDKQNKRYRYGNQPNIALWNLLQLANALYPLIEETEPLEQILQEFQSNFDLKWLDMMRSKLGLKGQESEDLELVQTLEDALLSSETDMTIFFRLLSHYKVGKPEGGYNLIKPAFYKENLNSPEHKTLWDSWFKNYDKRLQNEKSEDRSRASGMNLVNPKYVLRNYMAQMAIDAAEKGDYALIGELFQLLKNPYDKQPEQERWFAKRPEWARHKVGCSMLSCSS